MSLSSRANVFLIVNLGCEMLYVIDQRLVAQAISEDKSIQVIRDITSVLLEPKFIDRLIIGSQQLNAQLITVEHCKFMLNDIACCSLMQLDEQSMDKLWNLMTMIFKWQLFVTEFPQHLLDITFRHLDAVGQIYADVKRTILVDHIKNVVLDFWNSVDDDEQMAIYRTCCSWLECFNVKISLLIRLGFQSLDANFIRDVPENHFADFVETVGENIYGLGAEIAKKRKAEIGQTTGEMDNLVTMLNLGGDGSGGHETSSKKIEPQKNIVFDDVQHLDLNMKNILKNDLNDQKIQSTEKNLANVAVNKTEAFVWLQPIYNGTEIGGSTSWEDFVANRGAPNSQTKTSSVASNVSTTATGMKCRNILSKTMFAE